MTQKVTNLAIYGGSFDPIHVGHLAVISYAMAMLQSDDFWVMPCWKHAFGKELTRFDYRFRMVQLARNGLFDPTVGACSIEQTYETTYTYDLVERLYKERPDYQITLVVGEDAYNERHSWHRWDELIERVHLFPVGRMGVSGEGELFPQRRPKKPLVKMPEVSSTDIRRLIAAGRIKECKPLLPKPVLEYIQKHRLYEDGRKYPG